MSESKREREARKRNYRRYLRSPHWHRMRRLALERDRNRCQRCGSTEELSVHHQTYERLGQERLGDLITVCRDCHRDEHRLTVENESRSQSVVMDPAEARRARLDKERQERERAMRERFVTEEEMRELGGRLIA